MFSIVIVNWRLPEFTQKCVDSIRDKSHYKDHEIIVVHNEWDNKTKIKGADHELRYYENVGLSKAANKGAKFATKDLICLIDNDMEVTDQWDDDLLNSQMFMLGSNWTCCTMIEPNPSITNIKTEDWWGGKALVANGWYKQISNTPLLIPKKFWEKIGGYDEDFPNVGAELGLAKRAYNHGERDFIQTPLSMVFHHQSQSMNKLSTINEERKQRDITFKNKYGITRKQFIKLIGKGEKYDTSV